MIESRNRRFQTVQPGISISSRNSTNGTLGLIVFDQLNNHTACILSNWHVLAARKPKRLGFSLRPGANVYQPGKNVTPLNNNNIIAKLVRHNKRLDCAVARIVSREFNLELFETNALITSTRIPKKGDIVEKSGTRTGVTRAKVDRVNGNWVHLVPVDGQGSTEISKGGDSGSVWYDPFTKEGLILHSQGDSDDDTRYETASGLILERVLTELKVSLTPHV